MSVFISITLSKPFTRSARIVVLKYVSKVVKYSVLATIGEACWFSLAVLVSQSLLL